MKSLAALLIVCLALAACSSKPDAGGGPSKTAVYQEPSGLFSCKVPAAWRVMENQHGGRSVSFFGPPSGPDANSVSISIYFYPKTGSEFSEPRDYIAARRASAIRVMPEIERDWKGKKAIEFSLIRKGNGIHNRRGAGDEYEDNFIVSAKDGFVVIEYSALESSRPMGTEEIFRAVIDSIHLQDS